MPQREVYKPPVRGGVPDAPRLRDRRAALDASVRHDRQHPRHLRCVRLCPQPHLSNFAGTARAPFLAGEPASSVDRGRAGVGDAAPYGVCVWVGVSIMPLLAAIRGRVRRTRSAWPISPTFDTVRPSLFSAQRMRFRGHSPRTILCGRANVVRRPRPGGRGSPPLRWIG